MTGANRNLALGQKGAWPDVSRLQAQERSKSNRAGIRIGFGPGSLGRKLRALLGWAIDWTGISTTSPVLQLP